MKRIILLSFIIASIAFGGCSSRKLAGNSTALLLQYMEDESPSTLTNLSKAYGSDLSRKIKESRPQPGECAEYAVTLAKLHQDASANAWFNLEVYYHPASTKMVDQLKYDLIPQYASDHSTDATEADLSNVDGQDVIGENANVAANDQPASATKVKLTKKEKKKIARQKAKTKRQAVREKKKAKKAKLKAKKQKAKAAKKAKAEKAKARKAESKARHNSNANEE